MKFVAVPILCLLILAQAFRKWLIVIEYNINKDYIAKNLCENRKLPKMHCNGKCQLMKRLAEEEKQNSPSNTGKIKSIEVLFSDAIEVPSIASLPEVSKKTFAHYSFSSCIAPIHSVFHPPTAA